MSKTIDGRVSDAFGDDSVADAKEYLGSLSSAWKDISASLTKQTILLFLLMAVFELLVYQRRAGTITFGAITIASSSVVLISLPTIVAYLMYDEFRLTARWLDINKVYIILYRKVWNEQSKNDLDTLITPMLPGLWRIGTSPSEDNEMPSERFIFVVNAIVSVTAIILFPLAFELQSYIVLFAKFGFLDIFLWVNALVSFGLISVGLVYTALHSNE